MVLLLIDEALIGGGEVKALVGDHVHLELAELLLALVEQRIPLLFVEARKAYHLQIQAVLSFSFH